MSSIRRNGEGGHGAGFRGTQLRMAAGATLLLLGGACTGAIGGASGGPGTDPGQPPGGMTVNPPGGGGSGGVYIPPPPAENAPTTGNFASAPGPSSRFVRLSHRQWENTVVDLFKGTAPAGMSRDFLSEPIRSSFNNNGSVLDVSTALWQDYQDAAVEAGHGRPGRQGPRPLPEQRGQGRQDLHPQLRLARLPAAADRRRGVAVRGAVRQGCRQLVGGTDAFADGVELVVEAMLQSPHFLYRTELGTTGGQRPGEPVAVRDRLAAVVRPGQLDARRDAVRRRQREQAEPGRGGRTTPAGCWSPSGARRPCRDLHEQMFKLSGLRRGQARHRCLTRSSSRRWARTSKTEAETFVREIDLRPEQGRRGAADRALQLREQPAGAALRGQRSGRARPAS